jgi:hypothetical protein
MELFELKFAFPPHCAVGNQILALRNAARHHLSAAFCGGKSNLYAK